MASALRADFSSWTYTRSTKACSAASSAASTSSANESIPPRVRVRTRAGGDEQQVDYRIGRARWPPRGSRRSVRSVVGRVSEVGRRPDRPHPRGVFVMLIRSALRAVAGGGLVAVLALPAAAHATVLKHSDPAQDVEKVTTS